MTRFSPHNHTEMSNKNLLNFGLILLFLFTIIYVILTETNS